MASMHLATSKSTKGCMFGSDEDIKAVVIQWFQQQPMESFVEQLHWLTHQWDDCLNT
jgi:hypothetical protein